MPSFDTYIAKYGEYGVQAILEMIELREAIAVNNALSLEDRWNNLMASKPVSQSWVA